jgi:hypothetical protein
MKMTSIYEQNIHGAIYTANGKSAKAVDSWTKKDMQAMEEISSKLYRAFNVYNINPCYYGEYEDPEIEYSVKYTQRANDCEIRAKRTHGKYGRGLGYKITIIKSSASKGYREYLAGFAWALAGAGFNLDESGQRIA